MTLSVFINVFSLEWVEYISIVHCYPFRREFLHTYVDVAPSGVGPDGHGGAVGTKAGERHRSRIFCTVHIICINNTSIIVLPYQVIYFRIFNYIYEDWEFA